MIYGQPKWILAVSAILLIWGALLAAASYRTEQQAKDLPRMSCDELLKMGRAAPQFLTLSDVRLCQSGEAVQRDMDAALQMYVPVYSAQLKKEPRGPELRLLLEVLDERERGRVLQRPEIGELSVELWTKSSSLDPWVETRLSAVYPGIQLARCRVISVGLHEPSLFRAHHEWRDGILLMVLAGVCQCAWWSYRLASARFQRTPDAQVALSELAEV